MYKNRQAGKDDVKVDFLCYPHSSR